MPHLHNRSKGRLFTKRYLGRCIYSEVRHQEIHTLSLGNTRKYQEIPKKIRKYLEILGNTCKLQEILGNTTKFQEKQEQKHEILWYFYATLVRLEFFLLTGS
jgi:hypothetical protein